MAEDEIDARKAEDRQDADAFRILFYTGIRVGELVTLRWADVDLDARTLLLLDSDIDIHSTHWVLTAQLVPSRPG